MSAVKWWRLAVRNEEKSTDASILKPAELRRILQRECARSDRSGRPFSLALFSPKPGEDRRDSAERLANLLLRRVRLTDDVGWFDASTVALVLPETPRRGVRLLVDSLRSGMHPALEGVISEVFTYPDVALPGADEENTHNSRSVSGLAPRVRFRPNARFADAVSSTETVSGATDRGLKRLLGASLHPAKRALDLTVAALGLLFLSPLMLLIALIITVASPGPALYGQRRLGYLGRPFTCWKFRTMAPDADKRLHRDYLADLIDSEKPMTKLDARDDPRIFPFGRLLRLTCLDELPQLVNVLRGELSLVGPRPCIAYEARRYRQWHHQRFDVMPGLTGLWQVSGKERMTFNQMVRLDISYARRGSFWFDLKILAKTLPSILQQVKTSDSNFNSGDEHAGRA